MPKHQVQLEEALYREAQRRAAQAGFPTVDDYVADVLSHDLAEEDGQTPDLDGLFTPDRMDRIDKAQANIKGGSYYTSEQAQAELAKRRAEWLRKNSL